MKRTGDIVYYAGCIIAMPSVLLALGNAGVLMRGTDHPDAAVSRIIIGVVTALGAWLAGWIGRFLITGDWDMP